jgi:DNA-binding NarL/FixJ family response regulator
VLSLVAAGERDADIAETMAISIRTVRSYLDRIRDKTGRRRRPELTRFAIEEGIAHQPPGAIT